MTTKKLTKLLALYLPYILLGLVATNFGEAWRLAEGKELGDKIMSMMGTVPVAFANPLPSLHPLDLLVGVCCGAGLRLAVLFCVFATQIDRQSQPCAAAQAHQNIKRMQARQRVCKCQEVPPRRGVRLCPVGHRQGY